MRFLPTLVVAILPSAFGCAAAEAPDDANTARADAADVTSDAGITPTDVSTDMSIDIPSDTPFDTSIDISSDNGTDAGTDVRMPTDLGLRTERTLEGGPFADIVTLADGPLWIVAEKRPTHEIVVYRDLDLVETVSGGWPYALYPRACAYPGGVAVIFQGGDYPVAHWGGHTYTWTEDGTVFGIELTGCVWTGDAFVMAYVVRGRVIRRWVSPDGTTLRRAETPTDTTQGISRVLPDGTVTLVDFERTDARYPLLNRPWAADAHVVVGENRDGPARALGYHDGRAFVFLDGLAYRPRAAPFAGAYVAVATGPAGVRVIGFPPFSDLPGM